ncbi:butirosin biosynthesis protein BtrG [Planococcus antarcticus DSM 14505]|uniref:Branched-chain alpha-keto acid dehydrogenase n=1 Tax=Planococcus antarcticus DSM 14505 TaxID=1185653 RepID=A0A1C7DD55_9BACL|nr:gamma-glutamylcyclotransferase family protein [Planococcus antarcticus]ANU09374.1 branched-chain alpha-keto acid dehydrogenase [Planococcus antarcticus DSM 14505]EIM06025.1 butirosin biosynthesis protein BtrG [Planococcus antarcticus DSM 14505]
MLLFAYGTLKQGGKYHCYLEEAELVEEQAMGKGTLYDTGMGYPAMVLSGTDQIEGEIYDIPDVLWPALDYLEDYSGDPKTDLYDKVTIEAKASNHSFETIAYIAKDEKLLKQQISTGKWKVLHPVF